MAGRRALLRREIPDDLTQIVEYMDHHSVDAGERFANAAFDTFEEIATHPGRGSLKAIRGRKYRDIRSWRVRGFPKYLVLYRAIPQGIQILGVAHGARLLPKFLKGRLGLP